MKETLQLTLILPDKSERELRLNLQDSVFSFTVCEGHLCRQGHKLSELIEVITELKPVSITALSVLQHTKLDILVHLLRS